jgi:hypothetical protein
MKEYQKIPGPYVRFTEGPMRNKLEEGHWISEDVAFLADNRWIWTEKVDGTNIRVHWDGHKVTYGGRTDNAALPAKLLPALDHLFPEELFEQTFGATEVTLYGEGYGAGIQSGGVYRPDLSFVMFDVRIGDWWLRRRDVEDVGRKLGVDVVPVVHDGTVHEAISLVRNHELASRWNDQHEPEGLVGVTAVGLLGRDGNRIMLKIKRKDFQ